VINIDLPLAKAFLTPADEVMLSTVLLGTSLTVEELGFALQVTGRMADHYDTKLRDRFGGHTWFEDEGEPVDV